MPHKTEEAKAESRRKHYQKHKERIKIATKTYRLNKKSAWQAYKQTLFCIKCGQNHPATLDFHHIVPSPSNRKLHSLVQRGAFSLVLDEIKKCMVLCANCHRILHHNEHQDKKKAKGP